MDSYGRGNYPEDNDETYGGVAGGGYTGDGYAEPLGMSSSPGAEGSYPRHTPSYGAPPSPNRGPPPPSRYQSHEPQPISPRRYSQQAPPSSQYQYQPRQEQSPYNDRPGNQSYYGDEYGGRDDRRYSSYSRGGSAAYDHGGSPPRDSFPAHRQPYHGERDRRSPVPPVAAAAAAAHNRGDSHSSGLSDSFQSQPNGPVNYKTAYDDQVDEQYDHMGGLPPLREGAASPLTASEQSQERYPRVARKPTPIQGKPMHPPDNDMVEPNMPSRKVNYRYKHSSQVKRRLPDICTGEQWSHQNTRSHGLPATERVVSCLNCRRLLKTKRTAVLVRCPACTSVSQAAAVSL